MTTTRSSRPSATWPGDTPAGPPGEGDIYRSPDRGDTWERVGRQKRGSKFLGLPAIRVLWAAAES